VTAFGNYKNFAAAGQHLSGGGSERDIMIIDIHTHIFPPAIRRERQDYFEGEAAFKLLYESPRARMAGARQLVEAMDEQGVDVSVVFGFPWKTPGICRMHNDYVIEAVQRYPDRLVGLACLDAAMPDAAREVERCLEAGLAGMGELAFYGSGIDRECLRQLEPLMAVCRRHLTLIHTNEPVGHQYPGKTPNTLAQLYRLVRTFPENSMVLAHWGGGLFFYNLLKKEVKESLKNVWFDTAASPYLYDPSVYRLAADIVGAEKVLFGSDYPLLPPARYFNELKISGLSPDTQAAVRGGSAARLLQSLNILPDRN
jgi:predicted TIM-barrel fold metal-dependent hydrolase